MKVAEGQLELLQDIAEFLRYDKSMPSELIRTYVGEMVKDQAVAPDVLQNTVHVTPDIDGETGKLVKYKT
ncbi:hypothetical protein NNJEOMEG_02866 [Fundidesulfovibrio magnetotacticus]|uniref:Uncharacterized protein n=1 Tax=Fundidesulfovibrio magnetotacticus TaxID=2730080 RepID=A0A6V8LXN9_9BACT|nr:hypothetical protein [Fundidesulfovibrio magnetotacticus]GFK95018.1 hypothetical protein NNJEOMEG_02866 [Fundidesulfovibrio magnetotacticus]